MTHPVIAKKVAEIEKDIETARGYSQEAEIFDDLSAAFQAEEFRGSIGIGPHVLNGFLIMWDVHRLSDVAPVLAWLRKRLDKSYKVEDYPELGRRTYDFGRLKLSAFFSAFDEKTVCKFVQVGVKEQPVYKLMCDGNEVDAPAEVIA